MAKRKEYRDNPPTAQESMKLNRTLHQYLDREVKLRENVVKEKKGIVSGIVNQLRHEIPHTNDVYYCGSAYENLATNGSHDYDVMFDVAPKGSHFVPEETRPGFVKLKYESGAPGVYPKTYVSQDGYLSREKVMDRQVKSHIDKYLTKNDHCLEVGEQQVKVARSQHGPAVTLHVDSGRYKFDMDIVVTVGGCRVNQEDKQVDYVAKAPDRNSQVARAVHGEEWRMSYSRKEREEFKRCDDGNQCHKDVLRVFKHLRGNHPTLRSLPSYVYKNVMLNLMKEEQEAARHGSVVNEWKPDKMADRFRDVVKKLYFDLDKHSIPVRFNPDIDLLSGVSRRQTDGLRGCMRSNIGGGWEGMMKMLSY